MQVLKEQKFMEMFISEVPIKRVAQPEEIAKVIKFFCCDDSSFVTGQTLYVDGGFSVRGLVNNAGTNIRKLAVDFTKEDYTTIMETNLESVFVLSQLCHPLLKASGSGSVVHVGSVSGGPRTNSSGYIFLFQSVANKLFSLSGCIYAMCKAALQQFAKSIACEWAKDNIRVNCVAPGYIQTPLAQQVLKDEKFYETVLFETPMKRIGQAEEIAKVIRFFSCDDSSFVTGQTLYADGGYSVRGLGY
eukprot:g1679.t1